MVSAKPSDVSSGKQMRRRSPKGLLNPGQVSVSDLNRDLGDRVPEGPCKKGRTLALGKDLGTEPSLSQRDSGTLAQPSGTLALSSARLSDLSKTLADDPQTRVSDLK